MNTNQYTLQPDFYGRWLALSVHPRGHQRTREQTPRVTGLEVCCEHSPKHLQVFLEHLPEHGAMEIN